MKSNRLEVRECYGVTYSGFLPPELWDAWTEACEWGTIAVFSYHTPIAWQHDTHREDWTIPDVDYSPETAEHQHFVNMLIADCSRRPKATFDKNLLG